MRFPQYVEGVLEGKIKPGAPVKIIKETPTTAVVDCGFNFGQVGASFMADVVCEKPTRLISPVSSARTATTLVAWVLCTNHRREEPGWVRCFEQLEARALGGALRRSRRSPGDQSPRFWGALQRSLPHHPGYGDLDDLGRENPLLNVPGLAGAGWLYPGCGGNPITDPHSFYEPQKGTIFTAWLSLPWV